MSKEDGKRGRDEGMARAIAAANPAWVEGVWECIKEIAYRQAELSSDDVVALAEERGVEDTHEHRALGALMTQAGSDGYIKTTERFISSNRTSKHLSPIRVWKSLVFGGQPLISKRLRKQQALFAPPSPPDLRVVK